MMRHAALRLMLATTVVLTVIAVCSVFTIEPNAGPSLRVNAAGPDSLTKTPAANQVNAPADGWLTGWANRVKLTIDHSQVDASLSDLPLLLYVSRTSGRNARDLSFVFDELGGDSNRKRIAITTSDGTTECFAEIEEWCSADKVAWIWVKVPGVASEVDTELYLYYDRNHPDNTSMVGDPHSAPAQSVWDGNFNMVQHLEEHGNGTAGEFRDSTSNANDSAGGDPDTTPTWIDHGSGQLFDGNNDFIEVPNNQDFSVSTTGGLTISAWIRPDVNDFPVASASSDPDQGEYVHWLGKSEHVGENQCEWVFRMYSETGSSRPNRISFYVFNLVGGLGVGSYFQDTIVPGEWIYVTAVADASRTYIYRDGILRDTDVYTATIVPTHGAAPVRIGHVDTSSDPSYFLGAIDEVRISNVVRSSAWIRASWASENDSLLDFGTPESAPNQIPDQPGNTSPAFNGATGLSLTPTLQSSAFGDPDTGDTHGASQWQIAATSGDYASPVFDSGTDYLNLVSILVPSGRLAHFTTYYWHVRHQDNHGDWSCWSVETSFVTMSAPGVENTGVSISAPTEPINSGEHFIISIVVVPGTAIARMQFDLRFDPSTVTVDKVEEGDLLAQNGASTYFNSGYIDNQLGIARGAFGVIVSRGETVSKEGIFATVTFTARKGSASCPLSLSNVIVEDMDGNAVPVSLASGSAPEIIDGNESVPGTTEGRVVFRLWVLGVIVGAAAALITAAIAAVLFQRRQMVKDLRGRNIN